MAKVYRLDSGVRLANAAFALMTRLGIGANYRHILTVRGRRSGLERSTPVDVMNVDGRLFLVAPYGISAWVHNLRAAGRAELRRGKQVRAFTAEEIGPPEAIPVIRAYLRDVPITRAYWDVSQHSSDEEIAADAPRHPVFALTDATDAPGPSGPNS